MTSRKTSTIQQMEHDHITTTRTNLHWLPVEHQINYKLLCLAYKALHGLVPPPYLTDLLKNYSPSRSLHSADHGLLSIPKACTVKLRKRAFAYVAPAVYNKLPLDIRKSSTFNAFKASLKTHYFEIVYSLQI